MFRRQARERAGIERIERSPEAGPTGTWPADFLSGQRWHGRSRPCCQLPTCSAATRARWKAFLAWRIRSSGRFGCPGRSERLRFGLPSELARGERVPGTRQVDGAGDAHLWRMLGEGLFEVVLLLVLQATIRAVHVPLEGLRCALANFSSRYSVKRLESSLGGIPGCEYGPC